MTTSSRMTFAFARDGGLPFSRLLSLVHPTLLVPLNALSLTTILVLIFGCIFLGSSSAFNAIVSASVVALGVTYAIPPLINCLRGRRMLPEDRAFRLPAAVGWVVNVVGIAYTVVTTVLFVFPPVLPVTGSNMNYCVVVFAIILGVSVGQWFVDGKRNFRGPRVDEEVVRSSIQAVGPRDLRGESEELAPGDQSGVSSGDGATGEGGIRHKTVL
jgi:choline transport protein